jgi:hypothetical protein
VGVSLDAVTERLLEEGIDKFVQPYGALLSELDEARARAVGDRGAGGAASEDLP